LGGWGVKLKVISPDATNLIKAIVKAGRECKKIGFYPLSYFPQGGKDLFLPPWGKARMGVNKAIRYR
jgi:hypothetical protein